MTTEDSTAQAQYPSLAAAIEAYHKGEANALELEAAMFAANVPDVLIHFFIDQHRKLKGRTIRCDCCDKPLNEPGALLFEPPRGVPARSVKWHICVECAPHVLQLIKMAGEKGLFKVLLAELDALISQREALTKPE
jgi:hypothetical protein